MSSQRPVDWRLVLLVVIFSMVVLWLGLGTTKAHGQENLSDALNQSEAMLQLLVTRLSERQAQVEQLQADLLVMQTSQAELLKQYDTLEESWRDYHNDMVGQVKKLERDYKRARRWAIGFGVSTAVGFIVSILMSLK